MTLYGYCPVCGEPGVDRERCPNGNDRCRAGHRYPSRSSLAERPAPSHPPHVAAGSRPSAVPNLMVVPDRRLSPEAARNVREVLEGAIAQMEAGERRVVVMDDRMTHYQLVDGAWRPLVPASLFIVGLMDEEGPGWDLIGVFDDEAKAEAACTSRRHFLGPAPAINETLPDVSEPWPGCRYPQGGADLLQPTGR